MTTIRLKYVHEYKDRQHRLRRYFRRPGQKRAPLPGFPGSPEFNAAYEMAMAGERPKIGASRTRPGTIDDLVARFYTAAFPALAPTTKKTYRNVIEKFRADHGDKPVASLKREHVRAIVTKLEAKPGAANKMLRTMRMLMRFAIDERMRADDPTFGVKKVRRASEEGFREWTEAEVAAYQTRHPVGTKARLALDLAQYTAQRKADVIRVGPQHVVHIDGSAMLRIKQQKTGAELLLPILPPLAASLAATPKGHLCFLVTEKDTPFSDAGFGNWFRDRCREAGLQGVSLHGLRKVALRRLADAGATDQQLMAWGGHKTRSEVTRYTRGASQRIAAQAAAEKLIASMNQEQELANSTDVLANREGRL
jgi:integrase